MAFQYLTKHGKLRLKGESQIKPKAKPKQANAADSKAKASSLS